MSAMELVRVIRCDGCKKPIAVEMPESGLCGAIPFEKNEDLTPAIHYTSSSPDDWTIDAAYCWKCYEKMEKAGTLPFPYNAWWF